MVSGQFADVNFSTYNALATDTDPSGASRAVPGSDQIAWNQHGAKFKYSPNTSFGKLSPSRVGVHLRFGSLQIEKEITGPAGGYAPDEFLVDVSCFVGTDELDLGADAVVELNQGNGFTARIDGILVSEQGTSCTVAEQGAVGDFAETSRTNATSTVAITEVADPNDPAADVPVSQVVTIGNDYQYTGLSVTKRVDTDATGATFGPFEFTLACATVLGDDVTFDDDGTTLLTFSVADGDTFTVPANRIPVGAECTLAEVDGFFADQIVIVGDNLVDNGDGTAVITPGTSPAAVEVTNGYDAGTVTITKAVDGDGASRWGTGPFTFAASCVWQGQTVWSDSFTLLAGDSLTVGPYPIDTRCEIAETGTGGATVATLDPTDGVVVVPAPATAGGISQVALTATNTFDLTSLEVTKTTRGQYQPTAGTGVFRFSLACTWLVNGSRETFEVPGGAERVLSARNDYRATYGDLPSSAECVLTETDRAGASSVAMRGEVAGQTVTSSRDSIRVDLSQTGAPGNATIAVTNHFDEVLGAGSETGDDLAKTGAGAAAWQIAVGILLVMSGAVVVWRVRRRPRTA